ncbi:MAG: hypothetical protein A4E61_00740 [Syntrophorhabdus sp. PtaB.Bin184]|nr:MAG: hypothetical protein A4E61_00740 [Syntrophorhabdus sp. PtaB.Bin184]
MHGEHRFVLVEEGKITDGALREPDRFLEGEGGYLLQGPIAHLVEPQEGLRPRFIKAQPLLGLLVLCYVRVGPDDAKRPAVSGPPYNLAPVEYPLVHAVLAPHPVLADIDGRPAFQVVAQPGMDTVPVVRVEACVPLLKGIADLFVRIADHLLPLRGKIDRAGLRVPVPQTVAGALEGELPSLLALFQGLLGLPALRDVPGKGTDIFELVVGEVADTHLHWERCPVLPALDGFKLVGTSLDDPAPKLRPIRDRMLRVDLVDLHREKLLAVVSRREARAVVHVSDGAGAVDPVDAVCGVVDGELGELERAFGPLQPGDIGGGEDIGSAIHRGELEKYVEHLPVLPHPFRLSLEVPIEHLADALEFRFLLIEYPDACPGEFVYRVPGDTAHRFVHPLDDPVADPADADGRGGDDGPQLLFGPGDGALRLFALRDVHGHAQNGGGLGSGERERDLDGLEITHVPLRVGDGLVGNVFAPARDHHVEVVVPEMPNLFIRRRETGIHPADQALHRGAVVVRDGLVGKDEPSVNVLGEYEMGHKVDDLPEALLALLEGLFGPGTLRYVYDDPPVTGELALLHDPRDVDDDGEPGTVLFDARVLITHRRAAFGHLLKVRHGPREVFRSYVAETVEPFGKVVLPVPEEFEGLLVHEDDGAFRVDFEDDLRHELRYVPELPLALPELFLRSLA